MIVELDRTPDLKQLYGRSLASSVRDLVRTGGDGGTSLPDDELVVGVASLDRDHVARYSRVCGYRLRDVLPPTYLHVVAFPLAMKLMTEPDFPFPPVGVVHVANRITHHRPVGVDERPSVRARMSDLQPHPSGQRFDVIADATIDGETVWSETSTYLRKGDGAQDADGIEVDAPERSPRAAIWHVSRSVGRRYAAVSGDPNPIHLHPVPARLFGYPSNIAHGMWTMARALAALEGRLPDAYDALVRFGKPLVLPRDVAFTAERHDDGWGVAVHDAGGVDAGTPQLSGEISDL